jgi:hypothetical protein
MNGMLSDDDVTRLLGEAAASFDVPDEGPGFVLEELNDAKPKRSHKKLVRLTAVAAAVIGGVLLVQSVGDGVSLTKQTDVAGSSAELAAPTGGVTGGGGGTTGSTGGTTGGGAALSGSATSLGDLSTKSAQTAPGGTNFQGFAPQLPASAGSSSDARSALTPTTTSTIPQAAPGDAFEDGARIVKTGTIGLVVGDGKVNGVVASVRGIATQVRGYVADEKSQEFGDDPSSTITMRVPVGTFERTVQAVRDLTKNGVGKVDSSSTSGQDITAQYSDLQAQIQSLTATRNRFLTILSRANTIGETLSVQQRVDSTQLQIDRLEGQRRVLAKQSEMATLTVTVSEKPKAVAKAEVQGDLSKSWDEAKDGFTSGIEALIAHSGRALLVLIIAAVGLVVLRFGWRLARRRLV